MASVRKSLAISFADRYITLLIQFSSTLILARLLTPEEIGIFSLGAVIIGFAQMIRDFGVSNYLVQEKELTKDRIKTAFGVTLIIAWIIAIILLSLSDYIASYYEEAGVKEVIVVLCSSLFFIPFNATILGLLRRDMNFHVILVINLCAAISHTVTGITLAYLGFGFISLAWASVASAAATLLIGLLNRPENAQFLPSFREFKRIFSFGSSSSAASLFTEAGLSAPDLTISKNLGFAELGFYSRAVGLVSIFNYAISSAVKPIVLPLFSKTVREELPLKEPYLTSLTYFTVVAWPFFAFLAFFAGPVTKILYGDQWDAAVPVSQVLCLAFAIQALTSFCSPALISIGKVHTNLLSQLILQPPRIILTIIASFYGLLYVALVQVLFYFTCFLVFHCLLHRKLSISIREIISSTYKSLIVTLICCTPPILFYTYTSINHILIKTTSCGLLWAIFFVSAIYLTKHPIWNEVTKHIVQLKHIRVSNE